MKAFVLFLGVVVLGGLAAVKSEAAYGTAGCGLGSIVFKDQDGMVQIFASTTNGTSGTQTFGISSGTSNCQKPGYRSSLEIENFVAVNRVQLEKEAAQGFGESVSALGQIAGCSSAEFGPQLQQNFETVFSSGSDSQTEAAMIEILAAEACAV
jgi:hypothetical protein